MANVADNRKRLREMFSLHRSLLRLSRDTAHANRLTEIGADVALTSPKVYESGLVTNFDLRLVDLYGDDDAADVHRDLTAATGGDEIGY